ncbi:MAG: enolase C-terminal domain-like protein [Kofleriaceae bacterium]
MVAIAARTLRWPIAGHGAARGRTERAAVILEVRSERDSVGLGEAAPLPGMSRDTLEDAEAAIAAFARRAPVVIDEPDAAFALAASAPPAARFAIETALLDALARERGVSLASLLRPPGVPAVQRIALAAVVDDVAAARRAHEAGIRCFKIKLAADDDLARVHAISAAFPDAAIRIDGNRSWPRDEVAARVAALACPAIAYIEEPCRDTHLVLDGRAAAWFALDESLVELAPDALAVALQREHLVALVLKPTLLGGLSAVRALAAQARAAGVAPVLSHGLEGPIGTAACAELALAIAVDPQPDFQRAHATPSPHLALPAGLAAHPALAGWQLAVPQLAADHVHAAAAPGLGFVGLDLQGAVRACGAAR